MKKYLILILGVLTTVSAFGDVRTESERVSAAQSALQRTGSTKMKSRLAAEKPKLLKASSQLELWGYEDAGIAVIARESGIPAILGYTDGPVDMNDMAPALKGYLESLNAYIDYCLANGQEFKNVFYERQNTSVGPLVKAKWDQGKPYNGKTPMVDNQHCLTGCVATAMAQILYTHKLPVTCSGYSRYYSYVAGNRTLLDYNFYDMTFDWTHMKNTYTTASNLQKQAVADLMYACGVAVKMDYGLGESGAFSSDAAAGINEFFPGIKATYYSRLNADVVYEELDNRRPVYFSGSTTDGGHAFIIDGFNSSGYVHLNMGWGGSGDGYFTITDMKGFKTAQNIITIVPDDTPRETFTPLAELEGLFVTCDWEHPATEIKEDQWYFLQNAGSAAHATSQGKGQSLMGKNYLPIDETTDYMAPHLVRFVPAADKSGYYIQTGIGDYFGRLDYPGTVSTKSNKYTCGTVADGYFWFKDPSGYVMENYGAGSEVEGWYYDIEKQTSSNRVWQLLPAELKDQPTGVGKVTTDRKTESVRINPFVVVEDGKKILKPKK